MASSISSIMSPYLPTVPTLPFPDQLIALFNPIDLGSLPSTSLVALNTTCAEDIETHHAALEAIPGSFIRMERSLIGILIKVKKEIKEEGKEPYLSPLSFIAISYNPKEAKEWFYLSRCKSSDIIFNLEQSIECGMNMEDAAAFLTALNSDDGYKDASEESNVWHLAE